MSTPEELRYTENHEWLATGEGDTVRVGITAYAQNQLGDIVFVALPDVGRRCKAGEAFGEVESTKSVSEVYCPVAGEIVAVNQVAGDTPELINTDPYGQGWLVEIAPDDPQAVEGLLDAPAYQRVIDD